MFSMKNLFTTFAIALIMAMVGCVESSGRRTADTTDGTSTATDATDATDDTDSTDATDETDSTEATDSTDATDETDSTEATDSTDATDETDSADATDETDMTDGSDMTDGTDGPAPNAGLIVVHSDYTSSSVSFLTAAGDVAVDNVINSGSAPAGITTALSGDVVPARFTGSGTSTIIIDRSNGVLTRLSTETPGEVIEQIDVSTGFYSNPQDALEADGSILVTRYETNGAAGAADFDGGGDVLIVDAADGSITGRIDLNPIAADGLLPRPKSFALIGSSIWVTLDHIAGDFSATGSSVIVKLDVENQDYTAVEGPVDRKNCGGLAHIPDGSGIWMSCTGDYSSAVQHEQAGVVRYVPDGAGGVIVDVNISAATFSERVLTGSIAALDADRVFIIEQGGFDPAANDKLWLYDASTDTATDLAVETGAYNFGALQLQKDGKTLFLTDADFTAPSLRRFEVAADGSLTSLPSVETDSNFLPPRSLAFLPN